MFQVALRLPLAFEKLLISAVESTTRDEMKVHLSLFQMVTAGYTLLPSIPPSLQVGSSTVTSGIPDGWMGLDVGADSTAQFTAVVEKAATIVWNG